MPTLRQIRAAREVVVSSSLAEGLIKAGYSARTAVHPSTVTRSIGFIEAGKEYAKKLAHIRELATRRAIATANKASFDSSIRAIDTTTKNIELLTGGVTERPASPFAGLDTAELIARLTIIREKKAILPENEAL